MTIAIAMSVLAVMGGGEKIKPHCSVACVKRVHVKRKKRIVKPYNEKLDRMAQCESTGQWNISTGNGFYGGLQFKLSTWFSVGGKGYPHKAGELEQKYRAVILIKREGYRPWPICGRV